MEGKLLTTSQIASSNIRALSARFGLTQEAVANALGITQGSISRRWNGIHPWRLDELDIVAGIFGVSVAELVAMPAGLERVINEKAPAFAGAGRWAHRESNPEPTD